MRRDELTNETWLPIKELLSDKSSVPYRIGQEQLKIRQRGLAERPRAGLPWGPSGRFRSWKTVFQRLNRWCKRGAWQELFEVLNGDADLEHLLLDSTAVRAHQHAAEAKAGSRSPAPVVA